MKKFILVIIAGLVILITVLGIIFYRNNLTKNNFETKKEEIPQNTASPGQLSVSPTNPPGQTLIKKQPENTLETFIDINLTVISPSDGAVVNTGNITVKGETVSKADVFINDKETVADSKGNFSVSISLDEGENIIYVTAIDQEGNSAEKEITVTYNAG